MTNTAIVSTPNGWGSQEIELPPHAHFHTHRMSSEHGWDGGMLSVSIEAFFCDKKNCRGESLVMTLYPHAAGHSYDMGYAAGYEDAEEDLGKNDPW